MDAQPSGRFLTGHSSGGWATLWLQVAYPKIFGGTWSTSPDPSDFTDFTGPDIYAKDANLYRKADGKAWPLLREKGEVKATFEDFAKLERVLGPYGGQMSSFEWVFSPRGEDGRPAPLFDRDTGRVDPAVAAYWREHYDIAHRLRTSWPALKNDLDGKIHVIVGDADTSTSTAPRQTQGNAGIARRQDRCALPARPYPFRSLRRGRRPARALERDRMGNVCGRKAGCGEAGERTRSFRHDPGPRALIRCA